MIGLGFDKKNFNAVEGYNSKIDSSVCCNPMFIMIKMLPKVMTQKLIQQYPALCGVKGNFIPHLCIAIQYYQGCKIELS